MSDVDHNRLVSTEAWIWAEEFAKVCPEADQGLTIGWFAYAIETGRAAGRRAVEADRDRLRDVVAALEAENARVIDLLEEAANDSQFFSQRSLLEAILAKVDPGPRGEEERLAAIETPEGAEL